MYIFSESIYARVGGCVILHNMLVNVAPTIEEIAAEERMEENLNLIAWRIHLPIRTSSKRPFILKGYVDKRTTETSRGSYILAGHIGDTPHCVHGPGYEWRKHSGGIPGSKGEQEELFTYTV
jgi:hypothetical protein